MRVLTNVPVKDYIGTPYIRPLNYSGLTGIGVPLRLNWLAYGADTSLPNISVSVDLRAREVASRLIAIRSVYIDNMGSDNPIYIYFPDTGYTVVAQPNSAGWFKVYSNELFFSIIGLGFLTGDIPQTYVIVTNLTIENATDIEISSAISLWKASATISRGSTIYNTNLGSPALGDQAYQSIANVANGVFQNNLWNTPYASGFLYVTHISMFLYGTNCNIGTTGSVTIVLESTGIAGVLYQMTFQTTQTAGGNMGPFQILGPFNSMNVKLDATQTWRLRGFNLTNGFLAGQNFVSNFTTNPT